MVRPLSAVLVVTAAIGLTPSPARGQAIVEAAILGSAAGAAAPGIKGAGAASAGVFDSLRKTLESANKPAANAGAGQAATGSRASTGTVVKLDAPSAAEKAAVEPKDVSGITVGLTREELIRQFGLPALKTSEPGPEGTVELYTYMQAKGEPVTVTLKAGVVTKKTAAPRLKQTAVVTLP